MVHYNSITLIGNLTADPDCRATPSGEFLAKFTLAVQRDFGKKGDTAKVDFINCTAWRKIAEVIVEHCKKGRTVLVDGRLEIDVYEKDGENRRSATVVVESFKFVDSKKKEDESD